MIEPSNPQAVLKALLNLDFGVFLRKAFPWIRGGDMIGWNWHLDAIVHRLNQVASGESRRLLVTMPPRNLKSITISVAWVAWMLGKDPRLNFVCVSYSNELASKLARDCSALLEAPWYRELFPSTILSPKRSASGDFETTRGGGRLATSITGTLTGRGGDIIIIDDPIKPDEANSETTREAVNHWYQSTLSSRLNDKASGAIICVMQRLHESDLAGLLLEQGGWDQLTLPAIATDDEIIPLPRGRKHERRVGDVLHPAREARSTLNQQKLSMGSSAFEAQYQQQPVPATGNLIKAEWLVTYQRSPELHGQIVQSWDTASKDGADNDWSVCITALVTRSEIRILDVFRRKMLFPDLKRHCIRLALDWHAQALLIEDAASGTQLIHALRAEQPRSMPLPVPCKPEGDKYSRMAGASGQIEAGQLLLPNDASWLASFKSEILGFPNARHDDQADALSQLMSWVLRSSQHEPATLGSPILFLTNEDGSSETIGDIDGIFDDCHPECDPWGSDDFNGLFQ